MIFHKPHKKIELSFIKNYWRSYRKSEIMLLFKSTAEWTSDMEDPYE